MNKNYFSKKVENRPTEELLVLLDLQEDQVEEFILATLWELQRREQLPHRHQRTLDALAEKAKEKNSEVEYKSHFIPPDLPRSIRVTAYLLYSVLILELMGFFLLGRTTSVGFNTLVIPGSLITAITGLFVHKGLTWARFAFYVIFSISTLFYALTLSSFDILGSAQQLLIVIALIFISKKESKNWYKTKAVPNMV